MNISDVEKITGVKSHILRYWEENILQLNPKKNQGGHRTYSEQDLNIIFRIKHLVTERGFTVEGAQKQMIAEQQNATEKQMNLLLQIHKLRSELKDIYGMIYENQQ